jgi:lipopolysaccharide biosynthesis glycosyltransferase
MLHSVLANRGERAVHVHFLHEAELPARSLELLAGMVERNGGAISFLLIKDEEVTGLRTTSILPASHWYRIFLPELLPELSRILYLDSDLIVLDSLDSLWETDLGDACLAAVTNVFQSDHLHRPAALGLSDPHVYFNSGVLLMNLDVMRRDGVTGTLVDYALAHHAKLDWPEQDALNVVLGDRRLWLHPRWNLMNSILLFPASADVFGMDVVAAARRRPAIRHFEGPGVNKPWHYLCDREMREVYFEHRRQTPWPRVTLEGRTPRNVLKRLVRDAGLPTRLSRGRDELSA